MIKVIARKGIRVPMEDSDSRYITDSEVVEVPASTYYQRRMMDGDLLQPTAEQLAPGGKPAVAHKKPAPEKGDAARADGASPAPVAVKAAPKKPEETK